MNLIGKTSKDSEQIGTSTWRSTMTRWSWKAAHRGGLVGDALSSMWEEEEDGGLLLIGGSHAPVRYQISIKTGLACGGLC
jgi:hypothetical protein